MVHYIKSMRVYIIAALLVSTLLVSGISTPANAKVVRWTPVEKTIITTPKGTTGSSKAFIKEVCAAIKAAPEGAQIQALTYWSSDDTVLNCLKYAKTTNKVNVSYTTWDNDYSANKNKNKKALQKLRSALGTDLSKKSYFKICNDSCLINGAEEGSQHAKAITISEVVAKNGKRVKNIVFISSGNFSNAAAGKSWNYSNLFVNRPKLYTGMSDFIKAMKDDKTLKNPIPTVVDGDTTFRFYPDGYEPIAPTLAKIKTSKVPKSYRANERAVVRVVMYYWMAEFKDVADQLCRLQGIGVDVAVAIKESSTGSSIKDVLKGCKDKNGKKTPIPTYNTEVKGRYSHGKVVTLVAKVDSEYKYVTFAGSVNFTESALIKNTEIGTEQEGSKYFARGARYFDHVKSYSKKLW